MTEERYFDVDRVLQAFGNNARGLIDYGAKISSRWRTSSAATSGCSTTFDNSKVVDSWHAMNTWVNDAIPLAGGAYRQSSSTSTRQQADERTPPSGARRSI